MLTEYNLIYMRSSILINVAEKVVLDRDSFKALASETRISILKALDGKRMTVTQLSKELEISKPALLKHLEALIEARLISKEEKERKWIHYELTFKGKNLMHPERVAVTVLLTASILAFVSAIAAFARYFFWDSLSGGVRQTGGVEPTFSNPGVPATEAANTLSTETTMLLIGIVLVIIFAVILTLAILIKKKWGKPRF
jgi:ArsR family transcriptional regulator